MLGEGGYGTVHMATRKRLAAGKAPAAPSDSAGEPGSEDQSGDLSGTEDGEDGEDGEGAVHVAIKKIEDTELSYDTTSDS
eukprot:g16119.t1